MAGICVRVYSCVPLPIRHDGHVLPVSAHRPTGLKTSPPADKRQKQLVNVTLKLAKLRLMLTARYMYAATALPVLVVYSRSRELKLF